MILPNSNQQPEILPGPIPFAVRPPVFETQPDSKVDSILADLSPETSWGDRQIAARRLGNMRCREALPRLLEVLPADPFWMVRCTIIQSLEKIGDPRAIPVLKSVAKNDGFKAVRSCAATAVRRLSN